MIPALPLALSKSSRRPYNFTIKNSLRFREYSSTYPRLYKTFSTAQSDTSRWTVSFWYKPAESRDISDIYFFQCLAEGQNLGQWSTGNSGYVYGGQYSMHNEYTVNVHWSLSIDGSLKFRDDTWYHFVYAWNGNESAAQDRFKIYINGVRQLLTGTTPSSSGFVNWCTQNHYSAIGRGITYIQNNTPYPFRGYMAEFHSFDGYELDPTDFAYYDSYGNWIPKRVTNTNYGNNGFYLDFSDPLDLGADRSGNNNHFTSAQVDIVQTTATNVDSVSTSTGPDYLNSASYSGNYSYWGIGTTEESFIGDIAPRLFDGSLTSGMYGYGKMDLNAHGKYVDKIYTNCSTYEYNTIVSLSNSNYLTGSKFRLYLRGQQINDDYLSSPYTKKYKVKVNTGTTEYEIEPEGGYPHWITLPDTITQITQIGVQGNGGTSNCRANTEIYAVEVDDVILKSNDTEWTLTFPTGTILESSFKRGDVVYQSSGVYGTILSVSNTTREMILGHVTGTFTTGQKVYRYSRSGNNDYVFDSPTNSYATLDSKGLMGHDVINGDLSFQFDSSTSGYALARSSLIMDTSSETGKYYFEATINHYSTEAQIGIVDIEKSNRYGDRKRVGENYGYGYSADGQKYHEESSLTVSAYGDTFTSGDIIGCSFDCGSGELKFYKNGRDQGVAYTITGNIKACFAVSLKGVSGNYGKWDVNFGQRAFIYDPPTRFLPLSVKNLSSKKFIDGEKYFQTIVANGSGATNSTESSTGFVYSSMVTTTNVAGSYGVNGDPTKLFDGDTTTYLLNHQLSDIITFTPTTPITYNTIRIYFTNTTTAGSVSIDGGTTYSTPITIGWSTLYNSSVESTLYSIIFRNGARPSAIEIDGTILEDSTILSFCKNTFPNGLWWVKDRGSANNQLVIPQLETSPQRAYVNDTSTIGEEDYVTPSSSTVAWCWNASNPSESGFEIVEYTGSGGESNGTQNINHNLGDIPGMMILLTDSSGTSPHLGYPVWHKGFDNPSQTYIRLNQSNAATTGDSYKWGSTSPTSTQFTVGDTETNNTGTKYHMLLWKEIPGFSSFGTYGGSFPDPDSGPVIKTGFKPAFVMVKCYTDNVTTADWIIFDNKRETRNPNNSYLFGNKSDAEQNNYEIDFYSDGFKITSEFLDIGNTQGYGYIYAAFAEKPAYAKNFTTASALT